MLKKLIKRGMKMVGEELKNEVKDPAQTENLEKVIYNLTASVNQLITISRENQEIMVDLATSQDEILNLMESELDYQEQEKQTNNVPKAGKIGMLN